MQNLNTQEVIEGLKRRRAELVAELSQVEQMLGIKGKARRALRSYSRGDISGAALKLLQSGPASTRRIRAACVAAGGKPSSVSGVIDSLLKKGSISRDENGLYHLA